MRRVLVMLALLPVVAPGDQTYRVYTEHPRLWLEARRLRLLQREHKRESVRWQQLELIWEAKSALREEPLARALEYAVAGREEAGRQAAAWALQRASAAGAPDRAELRVLALVFDWCFPLLPEKERVKVAERIGRGVETVAGQKGYGAFSAAVLGAIAAADDWRGSEQALTGLFEKKWRLELLPALREGRGPETPADTVALLEICHAARDNLNLELWDQAPAFFRQFPTYLLLNYYPAPVVVDGHRYRQPARFGTGQPDPAVEGELARIVELLTAAYDTNSVETQFLQGWITHDIYRLRSPTGAWHEFLWMNPYQPGLSYYNTPLHLHDDLGGRLLARSSWDDDATWLGYAGGELQLFADGSRSIVDSLAQASPIVFPQLAVMPARGEAAFQVRLAEGEDVFVVGLEAGRTYWVKSGEEKHLPRPAGKGGILPLKAAVGAETRFEIRTADPSPPAPALERKKK